MNKGLTRKNIALSTPSTGKQALTVGTVGSSAAAKRAWKRRSRYCICQVNSLKKSSATPTPPTPPTPPPAPHSPGCP